MTKEKLQFLLPVVFTIGPYVYFILKRESAKTNRLILGM